MTVVAFQRTAGSSSDGTEDSDFSADLEHAEAAENLRRRSSARLTRSSLRLNQSSQGTPPKIPIIMWGWLSAC